MQRCFHTQIVELALEEDPDSADEILSQMRLSHTQSSPGDREGTGTTPQTLIEPYPIRKGCDCSSSGVETSPSVAWAWSAVLPGLRYLPCTSVC